MIDKHVCVINSYDYFHKTTLKQVYVSLFAFIIYFNLRKQQSYLSIYFGLIFVKPENNTNACYWHSTKQGVCVL